MRSRERESFSPLSLLLLGASFSVGIQTREGRSGGEREKRRATTTKLTVNTGGYEI